MRFWCVANRLRRSSRAGASWCFGLLLLLGQSTQRVIALLMPPLPLSFSAWIR